MSNSQRRPRSYLFQMTSYQLQVVNSFVKVVYYLCECPATFCKLSSACFERSSTGLKCAATFVGPPATLCLVLRVMFYPFFTCMFTLRSILQKVKLKITSLFPQPGHQILFQRPLREHIYTQYAGNQDDYHQQHKKITLHTEDR